MAARRKTMATDEALKAKILAWMREYDGVSIQEVSAEFEIVDTLSNRLLVEMSNDDLVDVAGGMWVVIAEVPTVTKEEPKEEPAPAEAPKRTRRTKAQIAADKEEERKRLEYATRAAETQDEVMSQSPQVQQRDADLSKAEPTEEPVKAADGSTVTVPVSEGSEGAVSENWVPSFTESKNVEDFEPPTILPAVPEGVKENTWFMAHCADTKAARAWWMAKAQSQMGTAA